MPEPDKYGHGLARPHDRTTARPIVACQLLDGRNCLSCCDEAIADCGMTAPVADGIAAGRVLAVRGNVVDVRSKNVRQLTLHLHPRLIDFDRPVRVVANGTEVFAGEVQPSLADMLRLVVEFDDPYRVFWRTLRVEIPDDGEPTAPQNR